MNNMLSSESSDTVSCDIP